MRSLFPVLTFLLFTNITFGSNSLSKEQIKYTTQKVLDKLYTATGNYVFLKPKLQIRNTKQKVAAYLSGSKTIILEIEAYKVCQSLGKDSLNALAFIIGHELAHALQADIQHKQESTNFLSYSHHIHTSEREEKTADIQGVFTAYLAGYKTKEVVPKVIQRIYETYGLMGKKMSKYPPYEVRLNIAEEVDKQVEELIQLFEVGNYLAALGQHEYASACYEFIEKYYQGEEIYLNMGVNLLLHAINFSGKNVDRFLYPLEMEWDTRLKKPKARGGIKELEPKEIQYRKAIIRKAVQQLKKAQKLNFQNFRCDINLLCAYNLLGEYHEVIAYYKTNALEERADLLQIPTHVLEKAQLALAIAYAQIPTIAGQTEAKNLFQALMDSKNQYISTLAKFNLETLENKDCEDFMNRSFDCIAPFDVPGVIDNVLLHRLRSTNGKVLHENSNIQLSYRIHTNSATFRFDMPGKKAFSFQRVFNHQPQNFTLQNNDKKPKTVSTSHGYFLICEDDNTIFLVKEGEVIEEWGKFF